MNSTGRASLIRTKLHPPRVTGLVVPRPRLFTRLDQGAELPLTLVSAPAGYGKSTLVASWLATGNRPTAWVSLDEGDSDLRLFLVYLLEALESVGRAAFAETRAALVAAELPAVSEIGALLGNEIDALDHFSLVLDDYHLVRDRSVHDLLAGLLQHPPHPLHLVILTRADPPLPLEGLRGKGRATELRARDLQFSEEEALALLRNTLGREPTSEAVARLAESTEGWAVGLQLAALGLRRRPDTEDFLTALPGDFLQAEEFLVGEVLAGLDPGRQAFLLAIAVVERFSAGLCEALLTRGGDRAIDLSGDELVTWLVSSNLFVSSLDERREWYRFHHLFRELLLHRLETRDGPARVAELHRLAGEWLEANGYLEEALAHFLRSDRRELAVELVRVHRHELMNREEWSRLDRWLQRLPAESVRGDPELLIQRTWILENRFQYAQMLELVDQIEALLESDAERPPAVELRAELDALASAKHYFAGDGPRAESFARCSLHALPRERRSQRGFALVVRAFALQMMGRFDEARAVALKELGELRERGSVLHTRILIGLCFLHAMEGELEATQRFGQELLAVGGEFQLPESVSFARYFLGLVAWDRNDLVTGERVLAPVTTERVQPHLSNQAHCLFLLALIRTESGRTEEARELLGGLARRALGLHHSDLIELGEAFEAELSRRQGRPAAAMLWARRFEPDSEGPRWRFYLPELTWIRLLLDQGTPAERPRAVELLERLEERARTFHHRRLLIDLLALGAQARFRTGDEPSALAALREAIALAQPRGVLRPFLDLRPELSPLFDALGWELTASGLRERESAQASDPADGHAEARMGGPDALSDRELEVLELLAERLSNKEIAARLGISSATVKRHNTNIFQKLQVDRRRQAVAKARALGILPAA